MKSKSQAFFRPGSYLTRERDFDQIPSLTVKKKMSATILKNIGVVALLALCLK